MRSSQRQWVLTVMTALISTPWASAHGQFALSSTFQGADGRVAISPWRVVPASFHDVRRPSPVDTLPPARRPSYSRYAAWGTGIGALVGLGVGTYSYRYNNSGCGQCFTPDWAIPAFGAVVGAVAGFVAGSVGYLLTRYSVQPS